MFGGVFGGVEEFGGISVLVIVKNSLVDCTGISSRKHFYYGGQ